MREDSSSGDEKGVGPGIACPFTLQGTLIGGNEVFTFFVSDPEGTVTSFKSYGTRKNVRAMLT